MGLDLMVSLDDGQLPLSTAGPLALASGILQFYKESIATDVKIKTTSRTVEAHRLVMVSAVFSVALVD